MLNNSRESWHPFCVPDCRGTALSFSSLRMILAVGFSYMAFMMFRYVPSIPTFLKVFIKKGCCILSNAFSASIERIRWFFPFFNWCDESRSWLCRYWTSPAAQEWILLDHGEQFFLHAVQFNLLVSYWKYLYPYSSAILACNSPFFVGSLFGLGIKVLLAS